MDRKILLLNFITVFFLAVNVYGQRDLKEANILFDRLAYADAIPKFEKAILANPESYEAMLKLAESYRLTGNYVQAERWYEKVVLNPESTDLERFHYGQMLMNNGRHAEASKWLKIAEKERSDERIVNYLEAIEAFNRFFADSVNYKVINAPFNENGNDFSPVYFNDGIVYTSSKHTNDKSKTHSWTGESFTKLFFVDSTGNVREFAKEIQTKLNNGPLTIADKKMLSTINIRKVENAKKDIYRLNLIESELHGGKWSKAANFVHNSNDYNIAHPALSKDGKILYFASDMPDGEGGMDIYYSERLDNRWSPPQNAGKFINTPGNEIFPYFGANNILYFASNGHQGLGGLDIYASPITDSTKVIALSYPVNTRFDDFGFIISEDQTNGYFSSNRPGGKGGDDIYSFVFNPSAVRGVVKNKQTEKPLEFTRINIINKKNDVTTTTVTDSLGRFFSHISPCTEYEVTASHEDYSTQVIEVFLSDCSSAGESDVTLLFSNPTITLKPFDKYSGNALTGISFEIRDGETKALLASFDDESSTQMIEPCREYLIVANKTGFPEVKTYHKTPCIAKDETVGIPMGIPPPDPTLIAGTVYDQTNGSTLDSVMIVIYDSNNKAVSTSSSDGTGNFLITGFKNVDRLVFFRNGYFSVTKVIKLQADRKQIATEMPKLQLDRIIQLDGIFYDLGKSNIRPDAARVLDNVVKVMQENPSLSIELSAHTDARGNDESNMLLSDKRAKAAAAYVIQKGIAETRIIGRGYGESMLKNKCINGVKCSEQEHQENRRTEVKVVAY